MRRLMHRFLAMPEERRRLLMEATVFLALARIMIWLLPFRLVLRLFRLRLVPIEDGGITLGGNPVGRQIGSAVDRAALVLPFPVVCLPRAIAAALMMRRRGISGLVFLGVALVDGGMEAHAWTVTSEGDPVVGAPPSGKFTPIAAYRA